MVIVKFHTLLRRYAGINSIEVDVDQTDISGLLSELSEILENDDFIDKVLESDGTLRRGFLILVNGRNILNMDNLNTVVKHNDSVSMFPPAGGG